MNKKVIVVVVVLLLLLLAGAGYYLYTKSAQKPAATATTQEKNEGVFGSIKDALSKSLSLQCAFTSENGVPTTAYIKAGAVRVDTTGKTPEQTTSIIMKNKTMYFWPTNSKQGSMMTIPDVSITPSVTGSTVKPTGTSDQSENMMAALEKFKDSCKPAVVADSLFTPPSDVKFTDMSQMMKAVVPSGTPSGYPTGMSQQDVQKMMQQYKPTGY